MIMIIIELIIIIIIRIKKESNFQSFDSQFMFRFFFLFFTFFTRKDRILSIILLLLFLSWKWWLWWKWLAIDNNDEKIFFHRCCRCFELKKKKIWSSNKKLKAIHTLCDQQYCSTIVRSGEEGEGEGKKWFDSKSMSRFIRLSYSCVCVRVWFHTSDICSYGI